MVLRWCFHLPQRTVCRPESPTLLVCIAPALSDGDPMDSNINYAIIMDNAPGPSDSGDLRLSLVPDPSIATDGSALVNSQFRSGAVIQIRVRTCVYISAMHPIQAYIDCHIDVYLQLYNILQGTNLDSVHRSEIRVFVGGEPCNIEVQPSSEQV